MDLTRHIALFNRISGVYNWFFNYQVRHYQGIIMRNRGHLGDRGSGPILDMGCGTGAFARSLKNSGFDVVGLDAAYRMVQRARLRGIVSVNGDAVRGLPFRDKSFETVTAAFVAHGLDYDLRQRMFREASRVARSRVIFHDFHESGGSLFIRCIEYLEGGDYFRFIKDGADSMKPVFSSVDVVTVAPNNAWYICTP